MINLSIRYSSFSCWFQGSSWYWCNTTYRTTPEILIQDGFNAENTLRMDTTLIQSWYYSLSGRNRFMQSWHTKKSINC